MVVASNMFWLKVFYDAGQLLRNRPLWLESQTHSCFVDALLQHQGLTDLQEASKNQTKP